MPHVLRVPKFFQIIVSAALSTALVRIDRFRQNFRTLALDPCRAGRSAIVTRIASTRNSAWAAQNDRKS